MKPDLKSAFKTKQSSDSEAGEKKNEQKDKMGINIFIVFF